MCMNLKISCVLVIPQDSIMYVIQLAISGMNSSLYTTLKQVAADSV